jgi:16S rRNA U516 pseudouridylate synthase RsuA-like enzyme
MVLRHVAVVLLELDSASYSRVCVVVVQQWEAYSAVARGREGLDIHVGRLHGVIAMVELVELRLKRMCRAKLASLKLDSRRLCGTVINQRQVGDWVGIDARQRG